jgi:hypothetical protein
VPVLIGFTVARYDDASEDLAVADRAG